MKFYKTFPFILLLLFFLHSCDEMSNKELNVVQINDEIAKFNSHYKKAKKYKHKPQKSFKYIDSAITIAMNEKTDSLYLKALNYKIWLFYTHKNYKEALRYSDSLLKKAKHLKDTFYIAKVYLKKGIYNYKLHETIKAFNNYSLSKKYYLAINDSVKVASNLLNMATLQKDIGDYSAAKATVFEGLKYSTNTSNNKYRYNLYNVLSIIKKEEQLYVKALEYKEESIQILRNGVDTLSARDSVSLLKLMNNKAVIYNKKGDFKAAIQLLNQISLFPQLNLKNNTNVKAMVLDNLGVAKGKLKNKNAEEILLNAFRLRDSLGNKSGLNASYIHLCEFYIDENKFDEALIYAKRAYPNAQKINSLVAQKEALHYITKLQSIPEQKYISAYKKVADSLVSLSNQVRSIYAEEKYEAHEYKIKAIQGKKEANEAHFQKKMALLIGIVSILFLVLYKIYSDKIKREKNKKDQLITAYNTETRISKRVHDELANDVYGVMTQLQSDVTNKKRILDNLENIYNKSRNISRETNSIDTVHFMETLKSMLSSYNDANTNVISKGMTVDFWNQLADPKKIILFRVLQELMTNMKKHSKASVAVLNFSKTATTIEINYSDNGVGMNSNIKKISNGLQNAENRMESINGVFTFETEQNKGFKAKMRFEI